jgi:hypothetical protein
MRYKVHIVYPNRTMVLPQTFGTFASAATSAGPVAKNLKGQAAIRIEPLEDDIKAMS